MLFTFVSATPHIQVQVFWRISSTIVKSKDETLGLRTALYFPRWFVVVLQIIFAQPKCTAYTYNSKTETQRQHRRRTTQQETMMKRQQKHEIWSGNNKNASNVSPEIFSNTMTFTMFSHVLMTLHWKRNRDELKTLGALNYGQ